MFHFFESAKSKVDHSPYGINKDWYMSCEKLHKLGLKASEITEWLPKLLK